MAQGGGDGKRSGEAVGGGGTSGWGDLTPARQRLLACAGCALGGGGSKPGADGALRRRPGRALQDPGPGRSRPSVDSRDPQRSEVGMPSGQDPGGVRSRWQPGVRFLGTPLSLPAFVAESPTLGGQMLAEPAGDEVDTGQG